MQSYKDFIGDTPFNKIGTRMRQIKRIDMDIFYCFLLIFFSFKKIEQIAGRLWIEKPNVSSTKNLKSEI
jgi:hypothetical protein